MCGICFRLQSHDILQMKLMSSGFLNRMKQLCHLHLMCTQGIWLSINQIYQPNIGLDLAFPRMANAPNAPVSNVMLYLELSSSYAGKPGADLLLLYIQQKSIYNFGFPGNPVRIPFSQALYCHFQDVPQSRGSALV